MDPTEETFITAKPSEKLSPWIAYYYFHQSFSEKFDKQLTYYPHYKNALTVYQNSSCKILAGEQSLITPSKQPTLKILYSKFYDQIGKVHLQGKINKVGIVFQPLGINHFIDKPFAAHFPNRLNFFDGIGNRFFQVMADAYDEEDIERKAVLLDTYLLAHFLGFKETRIINAVALILKAEGNIRVQHLADEISVTRKTLLRLFQKHLGCSVEEYLKLVKFRFALDKIQQKSELNLTRISAENYYDQADFIKQFKTLTQLPPKKFISAVTKLGEEDTYWNFKP